MLSTLTFLLLFSEARSLRGEAVEAHGKQADVNGHELAAIEDLAANLRTGSLDSLSVLHDVEKISSKLSIGAGNASAHMHEADKELVRDVITIIRGSVYKSMNSSHEEERAELEDALGRIQTCNVHTSNELAATGAVGKLLADATRLQGAYIQLEAENGEMTEASAEKLSALTGFMSTASAAPASSCQPLPSQEIPQWKAYFDSNRFVDWFLDQRESFEAKRGEHMRAESALVAKTTEMVQIEAELRSGYCAFSLVLEETCNLHATCHETESLSFSEIEERLKVATASRVAAFEAGEIAIAHLEFVIGDSETSAAGDVDSSHYRIDIPDKPTELSCEVVQPAWEELIVSSCSAHNDPGIEKQPPNTENLLLGKPVTMPSQWSTYGGAYATDGSTCNAISRQPACGVAHTLSEMNAWIQVDMLEEKMLHKVIVWNGWEHCCRDGINPFVIRLMDASQTEVWVSESLRMDPSILYEELGVPVTPSRAVRYVRVELDNHKNYLHVAEIQAF